MPAKVGNQGAWLLPPGTWEKLDAYYDAFVYANGTNPLLCLSNTPSFFDVYMSNGKYARMHLDDIEPWTANLIKRGRGWRDVAKMLSKLAPVNIRELTEHSRWEVSSQSRAETG